MEIIRAIIPDSPASSKKMLLVIMLCTRSQNEGEGGKILREQPSAFFCSFRTWYARSLLVQYQFCNASV